MGPLQRAYSLRDTADAPKAADPLDESKHLDHIPEDSLAEDVTGSSVAAISSFLRSTQYQNSVRNFVPVAGPAYGGDGCTREAPQEEGGAADSANNAKDEEQGAEQGDSDEEEPDDAPPLKRGILSSQGTSVSGGSRYSGNGSYSRLGGEEGAGGPAWDPNMQLSLDDFDQDSVSYLAEGAMCQCFLARKIPASMNVPGGAGDMPSTDGSSSSCSRPNPAFESAREHGVIIKTPSEGPNQQMSENDLVIESLVLRELHHPNIVGILGGGTTHTGASFIVLEYLSMGTLRGRLDKCGGGLGVGPAVKYGLQLASALSYMHDGGLPGIILMHRDLKPDNIGFAADGQAKLMDFGLAKIIHRTQRCGSVKYAMTGETGSPRYMPPEVATNQPYNEKADVWSFIVIVWEMASGRLPFAGMSMEMYLDKVCNGAERPLVQNPWPADFKSLLRSSWQKDPDKRPSFREIHAVLSGMCSEMNNKKKGGFFGKK
ncbi:unnamed protein product [Ectocarpus sp. 6 AP-2014]